MAWVEVGNKSMNGNEHNVLLRNRGGDVPEFDSADYTAGVDCIEDSRGVGVIDIDLDGDLDLVVQTVENSCLLLVNNGSVNNGSAGNYLEVRLRGTYSNRDAIGARIVARVGQREIMREVTSTGGFISGRSLMRHFGLGEATKVDELTVHWPRGGTTRLQDVAANQRLAIVEPDSAVARNAWK